MLKKIWIKFIISQYKKIRTDLKSPFIIYTRLAETKKGKIKYDILIVETIHGKQKITINRHLTCLLNDSKI